MEIVFKVLEMLCGLALFLYGMEIMGDSLKKSAGSQLKVILGKMTSSTLRGFLLGLGVTAVIQSSSATTVMVVGFVNSGTMTLMQAAGVVMGAGIGTTVTAWLTGLSGIEGASAGVAALNWLKPSSWMPILAIIGVILIMTVKRGRKRDIAGILLGFVVLMVGMDMMSGAVSGLEDNAAFRSILTAFENPFLGILAGAVFTAVIQSSSASIGILQALSSTGGISFSVAIPIIVGMNIGTCITAVLSAISANRNGKRAALLPFYFKTFYSIVIMALFYFVKLFVDMPFMSDKIDMWGIAIVHTLFNIIGVIVLAPFYKQLTKLAQLSVRDGDDDVEAVATKLDERLFETPSIAAEQATKITYEMAGVSVQALKKSLTLLEKYDQKLAEEVRTLEERVDMYEDALGSYLVKLSGCDLSNSDTMQITKLLHIIGDLERISDHAVNVVESAEELNDKKLAFSEQATKELRVMRSAITEILDMAYKAFTENDVALAADVEPLEEVVDRLREKIKFNHVIRLQKSECSVEHGFVLSDLLNNFERVSDHCSNVAGCVIEISKLGALDMHKYTEEATESAEFKERLAFYQQKYSF